LATTGLGVPRVPLFVLRLIAPIARWHKILDFRFPAICDWNNVVNGHNQRSNQVVHDRVVVRDEVWSLRHPVSVWDFDNRHHKIAAIEALVSMSRENKWLPLCPLAPFPFPIYFFSIHHVSS
jgi:hypothetical protein